MISLLRRLFVAGPSRRPWDDTKAIREMLFSVERLEEHARSLATAQPITRQRPQGHALLDRLTDNEGNLIAAYQAICDAVSEGAAITPAAEWLIDNFHQVERQIRQVRLDLPPHYYRQLPNLADGPFAGYPRVFGMAWAFVAHTDSRFDVDVWCSFVQAYQKVQPLTIGELWASAITLRIILIENLRRIAERIVYSRGERRRADELANQLLESVTASDSARIFTRELEQGSLSDAFVLELVYRLRDQAGTVTPLLARLDQRLAAEGNSVDAAIKEEQQRQVSANVTVRNIITSMRHLSDVDWTEIFERVSLIDTVLADGCGYADMDFPTRNLYRTAVEELARGSGLSELEVARRAVLAGAQAASGGLEGNGHQTDPGYYLYAGGRLEFEAAIHFRPRRRVLFTRFYRALGIGGYVGAGAIVAALLLTLPILFHAHASPGWIWLGVLGTLGTIPALDAAVALVNQGVAQRFGATLLPALELRQGVPKHLRTLVVVPTLLTTHEAITAQIALLEIHYLANRAGDVQFALLSDWTDAENDENEDDKALLRTAIDGIARLNLRHEPAPGGARFLLFHRRRVWNDSQRKWIGWERKRGKLRELNRLLRGDTETTFVDLDGRATQAPKDVRYVVTLDADTRLRRDSIRRLVGKMAHPLNEPRLDPVSKLVVEGHAVLQPRITAAMPSAGKSSIYQRVFASMSGIDPYSSAISDVYQDLFEEGSYTGKGIYAVDAFEAALKGRSPDSTLLSHDLFEGVFARAALVSDIEAVEAYPTCYDVAALRYHRWARGDWQLLPWILGWSFLLGRSSAQNAKMPASGRWKMIDNLRRTLSPVTCLLALLAGWLLPFKVAMVWTVFVAGTIVLPSFVPALVGIAPRHTGLSLRSHFRAVASDFRLAFLQSLLITTLLAHQAWLMGDAIARTLFRFITRRNLLEWTPAAQARIGRKPTTTAYYSWMWGAALTGVAAPIWAWWWEGQTWLLALPFAILWVASPAIARWVSQPSEEIPTPAPAAADVRALRLIARRTWRFFETFVADEDHKLPPDNFQETPVPVVAHRTSPTNIGLYLLSAGSAHDFGWLGLTDTVERLEATFATMERLVRYRGHFYNWYDTRDLRPLDPQYISSVDSGNLAGHLIALANACEEWRGLDPATRLRGIGDALEIMAEEVDSLRDKRRTETVTWRQLDDSIAALAEDVRHPPEPKPPEFADHLARLAAAADNLVDITTAFTLERGDRGSSDMLFWAQAIQTSIASHERDISDSVPNADGLSTRVAAIAAKAREISLAMDFGFLLDPQRMLLSIGFIVPTGTPDQSCYDLLASEARLASYVAIAKGDLPTRHWFRLGRDVTPVDDSAALISWSGSMFEYLMPSLVMRTPVGSLLEQTNRMIVRRQIKYGNGLSTPWGVSESAYNSRDLELTYQYSNFGVPGLGLKRGLADNAVVAPYATALAATVDPIAAARNFEHLTADGGRGRYGFFEALDYTAPRVPQGEKVAVVRAFMAHHQGMSIVAVADAVLDGVMRRRFHAEPMVRAAELLLEERMPRDIAVRPPWASDATSVAKVRELETPEASREVDPNGPTPATHLLSNGHYSVMLTAAGSGYSRWRDLAITRWREDATCDDWGSYIYIRDVENDKIWSAGLAPAGVEPDRYAVTFSEDRATFSRHDGELNTILDVVVSGEDDAEVRRVTLTNAGRRAREIEVTSYAELVIAPQAADSAHPAFSKLFVQTEFNAGAGAIMATRRRRSPKEAEIWAAHHSVTDGEGIGKPEFETSRNRFIGRGRSVRAPAAVMDGRLLSGSRGSVLDPVFALRRRVRLAPGATVRIAFWTMAADSRTGIIDLVDKTNDISAFDRAATLSWTKAQVRLHHLGIERSEASLFQRLAGHLLYAAPVLRSSSEAILRGAGSQAGLWAQGISGDLPIVLLRISNADDMRIVHQLLQAMENWRDQGLAIDLVILNERASSYVQDLQNALDAMVRSSPAQISSAQGINAGKVFILRADLIPQETRALLASVARVVLVAERGGLAEQLNRISESGEAASIRRRPRVLSVPRPIATPSMKLEYFNGLGGFAADGKEYVTILGPGQSTPAPWINVIANSVFGFQVSAEGSGFTWSVNSREHQLTPWSNDPIVDRPGEALYVRDEDTDELWSPSASPIRDDTSAYVARHGWGYSRFEHEAHGIASDLLMYVPLVDPVKISRLRLRNTTNRHRRLSVTAYVEWVLGVSRTASAPFVCTQTDRTTGALLARNAWNAAFQGRVAFLDMRGSQTRWTGDRREFIGRNGVIADPAGLAAGTDLSGTVGAGLDPCGALQTIVELAPGGEVEVVVFLGDAAHDTEAVELITRYRQADLDDVLSAVRRYWAEVLGAVQVKTPERSMDIILNGWLLYQTIACRMWARSAFYQASGAYGFRDQIQDGMSLATTLPSLTREHLVRAAGRQFAEGDVQHWWLPHSGQGVRGRISDDKAWLAFAVAHYVEVSGDTEILKETIPFLEGPRLDANQQESFFSPSISDQTADLYQHCALALDASLAVGRHGVPLIGSGDWNDGMNRVGEGGRGESVWLGWMLHTTLTKFARLADTRSDAAHAKDWRERAAKLQDSLERHAWDGDWYRRAWFDDGTVMGSATNDECRIDSIAQSWAVISGVAKPKRAAQAMAAVERELIGEDDGLALLFTPPFERSTHDPGYIKAYPPGIRENGGQYTHAAIWSVIAFCNLGLGAKAASLFSQLNPINHARTRAELRRYKVEPYVVAADIYAAPDLLGHGGWTWYTGSAGWMHRAGIESILGLRFEGSTLYFDPCIPNNWPGFEISFRRGASRMRIDVNNPNGVSRGVAKARLDGVELAERPLRLQLIEDNRDHELLITLG